MSDYISIQEAIEKINERARETFTIASGYEYYLGALHDVADDLRQIPTIDAVPVVHGEWIKGQFMDGGLKCPFCGFVPYDPGGGEKFNYCSNCGAKMDGGKDDGKVATQFIAYDGPEARDPEFMEYAEKSMITKLVDGVAQKYGTGDEIILSFMKTEKMEPEPRRHVFGFYKMAKVEELVRCKDCIYFHLHKVFYCDDASVPPLIGNHVCDKWGQGCRTDPYGFCYMGERKDDETD